MENIHHGGQLCLRQTLQMNKRLCVPKCLTACAAPVPKSHSHTFVMLQWACRGKVEILHPNIFLATKVSYLAFSVWSFAPSQDRDTFLPGSSFLEHSSFMATLFPTPHPSSIPHLQRARQAAQPRVGQSAQPRVGQSAPSFLILTLAAAAGLKDRDLSGSFISILTNEWINVMCWLKYWKSFSSTSRDKLKGKCKITGKFF